MEIAHTLSSEILQEILNVFVSTFISSLSLLNDIYVPLSHAPASSVVAHDHVSFSSSSSLFAFSIARYQLFSINQSLHLK
jgi:hypothetical protein